MSQDNAKEKWVEISAFGTLFADGRCTDWDSKAVTRQEVEAIGRDKCIIEFKEYYFYNVYLVDFDDQTVTIKVGDKTATLNCGQECTATMPLDYAYSDTTVKLWSQSQLDQLKKQQQEEERIKKEREERAKRPFDPDNFDWMDEDDEFKRGRFVRALLNSMEKAADQQWTQAQAKAWEMRKVFRGYEALEAANICFYPKYSHVDLDAAQQWYLFAKERFGGVNDKYDQSPENKYLINENLARILYVQGKPDEADKYVEEGLEKDHNPAIEAWRLQYQLLTQGDYPKAKVEQLQAKQNVPALCMYLRLVAPTSDSAYAECTKEKWAIIHGIIKTLEEVRAYEPRNYSTYAYPAMLRYLEVDNNVFWEEEISDFLMDGVAKDNIECCNYCGIISWYTADLVKEVHGQESYDEIMEKVVLNAFRKAADQGDPMSCMFYAMALEKVKPDSTDIAKYKQYWQRLVITLPA